jgi:PKD repeat protein
LSFRDFGKLPLTSAGKKRFIMAEMRFLKPTTYCFLRAAAVICVACGFGTLASAQNLTLRIVCYNIEADIDNATAPLPGLIYPASGSTATTSGGVLEGIGEEILGDGVAQPIDILALEETTSNPQTIAPIVAGLNAFYGQYNPLAANNYAMSTYQAIITDPNDGNGPNALVYNTKTVQLLASVPVDPAGGSNGIINNYSTTGEYREVVRYEFAPAGQTPTPATEFYIYVSHYKSGSTSSDQTARGKEAVIIRTNESTDLPASARVLYVGDYNISTSSEASYQTILAVDSPTGAAQGQGVDPLNTSAATGIDWTANSLLNEKTEEDTTLHYRDDFQCITTNIYTAYTGGLAFVPNTYHAFGNNGSVPYEKSVNNGSNTALNSDLASGSPISATQLYADLVSASDHLPVVADYTIPVVSPGAAFTASTTNGAVPLAVTFTDASTGIVTNWFWNFGDGSTTNITNSLTPTHTYTTAGTYTVSETVTGPGGVNTTTKTGLVTVLTPYQAWQLQYFGCTNCPQAQTNADADGTGQDNLFKYIAGLNPTNPQSIFVFNLTNVANHPTEKNLIFSPIEAGRTYTPQYSTTLLNGTWASLAGTVTNITGTQATVTDTSATQPQKYYLIEINGP